MKRQLRDPVALGELVERFLEHVDPTHEPEVEWELWHLDQVQQTEHQRTGCAPVFSFESEVHVVTGGRTVGVPGLDTYAGNGGTRSVNGDATEGLTSMVPPLELFFIQVPIRGTECGY